MMELFDRDKVDYFPLNAYHIFRSNVHLRGFRDLGKQPDGSPQYESVRTEKEVLKVFRDTRLYTPERRLQLERTVDLMTLADFYANGHLRASRRERRRKGQPLKSLFLTLMAGQAIPSYFVDTDNPLIDRNGDWVERHILIPGASHVV